MKVILIMLVLIGLNQPAYAWIGQAQGKAQANRVRNLSNQSYQNSAYQSIDRSSSCNLRQSQQSQGRSMQRTYNDNGMLINSYGSNSND